ncbi:MAG: NADH-quinone oxidoreductase subunit H [Clostridiales Family XIII bacterium]|jgi:formate hydrogenlyase subunit 4|nr:NADH-quinone oxidoreductase subunit H [Clostridiales Family XIII bacterium]
MTVSLYAVIGLAAYLIAGPFVGGWFAGVDRRITARMQGRFGPPILQPFYDVRKLIEKEPVTVNGGQDFYVMCFLIFIIITGGLFFFGQNLLLVIFTLTTANLFLVIGAYSSNSPYSQIGAERELLQMMAYEPMVLLTAVGLYMTTGSFNISDIMLGGALAGGAIPLKYLIGIFAGYLFILTIKFRKSPFDLSLSHHAHQELVKGVTTEFSGRTLALIEIAHWYENVFLLGFIFLFFQNGTWYMALVGVVVALACYFLEIFIDNAFARMKWQFTLKASWLVTITFGAANLILLYYFKGLM